MHGQTKGQAPGYQGLRFMLGYSIKPMINYAGVGEGSDGKPKFIFPVHNINANYVLSRKLALGASYEFASFKNILSHYAFRYGSISDNTTKSSVIGLESRFNIGEHNAVAPLGNYLSFKLIYGRFNIQQIEQRPNGSIMDTVSAVYNASSLGIGIGFGRTKIIFGRVVLDFGGQVGSYFRTWGVFRPRDFSNQNKTVWYNGLGSFMQVNELITFKVGISGLLF